MTISNKLLDELLSGVDRPEELLGDALRCPGGIMAGPDAGTQAKDAGGNHAGQQNGPGDLGHAEQRRGLPAAGGDGVSADRATLRPGVRDV